MKHRFLSIVACAILLCGCRNNNPSPTPTPTPAAPQEIRGVWVSYLDLDPLLRGADRTTAQARLDALLDTCVSHRLNTVFLHVRAHSDAYYASAAFPPAKAAAALLATGFDPLAYTVKAAHARGLRLHAWINPYRIGEDKTAAVCNDVFEQDGVWYYNPAAEAARTAVLNGVRELLDSYAIDGIHFDDYFYPTTLGDTAAAFEAIPADTAVGDWRRAQVDALVSAAYSLTHAHGKEFGISPTALPHTDRTRAYADTAMWLQTPGYVDYLCPQIYFGFAHETHPFAETLAEWEALPRADGTALYIGLALYKSGQPDPHAGSGQTEWCTAQDILARQVTAIRTGNGAAGFVLFRYAHLTTATQEMSHLQSIL